MTRRLLRVIIKPPLFWCLNRVGARFHEGAAVILAYHEIDSPAHLHAQLRLIHEGGWRVISLRDLCTKIETGRPLPPRGVVLTFDDGYLSHFLEAVPLLERFGYPASFFIVGDRSQSRSQWQAESGAPPRFPLMTTSQIRQLAELGFEVGAHGLTHRQLTRMPSQEMVREVREGKARLEADLGRNVDYFSYPYGDLNPEVMTAVRDAGYRGAVATIRGAVSMSPDLYALQRMTVVGKPGMEEFHAYLTGSMAGYLDFRDRLRGVGRR